MPPIFINRGFYNSDTGISSKYCESMGKHLCFFVIGVRRHEPLNDGVLIGGGGGGYFLFDISDLHNVAEMT